MFLDATSDKGASIRAISDGQKTIAAQFDPQRKALAACISLAKDQELVLRPVVDKAPETGLRVENHPGIFVLRNSSMAVGLAQHVTVEDAGDNWLITGPIRWVTGPDQTPRSSSRLVIRKSRFFDHDRDSIARIDPKAAPQEQIPPTVDARLVEQGPVFIRYQYDLKMSDGRAYQFTATLYAEHPILYVQEQLGLDREGSLEIAISDRFDIDNYVVRGTDPNDVQAFLPIPPQEHRLGSLCPHHTQGHVRYPWIGFLMSRRPQGDIRGLVDTEVYPYADLLVFMGHRPWGLPLPG